MPDTLPDILPLKPHLREAVWGGRRLGERFGKDLPADAPIGESLEVSALPGQECVVRSGPLAGRGLRDLLAQFGPGLTGPAVIARYGADFPLLIKLIDARDDLSIQVHPDDVYARREGLGPCGKTEAWYVLHADGAQLALGLREGTDRESLRAALAAGRVRDAVLYQDAVPHDVVLLRAGTVHAIGRGVILYEVQQSSDLTFRLYDYGRLGLDGRPRPLHVDRGLDVIAFGAPAPRPRPAPSPGPQGEVLVDVDEFTLTLYGGEPRLLAAGDRFAAITVIGGAARLGGCDLATGQSALIPAGRGVRVAPTAAGLHYLMAAPGC